METPRRRTTVSATELRLTGQRASRCARRRVSAERVARSRTSLFQPPLARSQRRLIPERPALRAGFRRFISLSEPQAEAALARPKRQPIKKKSPGAGATGQTVTPSHLLVQRRTGAKHCCPTPRPVMRRRRIRSSGGKPISPPDQHETRGNTLEGSLTRGSRHEALTRLVPAHGLPLRR